MQVGLNAVMSFYMHIEGKVCLYIHIIHSKTCLMCKFLLSRRIHRKVSNKRFMSDRLCVPVVVCIVNCGKKFGGSMVTTVLAANTHSSKGHG